MNVILHLFFLSILFGVWVNSINLHFQTICFEDQRLLKTKLLIYETLNNGHLFKKTNHPLFCFRQSMVKSDNQHISVFLYSQKNLNYQKKIELIPLNGLLGSENIKWQ